MCIAIPPPMGARQRRANPLWQAVSANPLRLLGLAALLQSALLGLLLLFSAGAPPAGIPLFTAAAILLIVLPTAVAGVLMQFYPRWLRGEPLRYVRYGSVFYLSVIGAALFLPGAWYGTFLVWPGALSLALGWWVGVTALWHLYTWAPNPRRWRERLINGAVLAGSMAGVLVAAGILWGQTVLLQAGLWLLLPVHLLVLIMLWSRLRG